ncbi:hypothetical protein E2C01_028988 [Portunus trituberculatus]|uniref:Secreted protein n=1 Tax=Portunus trituberculatus TaxID=210409 RepID=A0A5B7ERL4_PORTR|nr:hypothetical protein [Portunus trituberculatus]
MLSRNSHLLTLLTLNGTLTHLRSLQQTAAEAALVVVVVVLVQEEVCSQRRFCRHAFLCDPHVVGEARPPSIARPRDPPAPGEPEALPDTDTVGLGSLVTTGSHGVCSLATECTGDNHTSPVTRQT